MSIAAANLFTRNVYRDFIRPDVDAKTEASVSKIVSLVVKVGALIFVVAGLYTRWFDHWALLAGWAVGIAFGTVSAYNVLNPVTQRAL